MDLLKKLEVFLKKLTQGRNKKKVLENAAIIIIIGIILMIAGSTLFSKGGSKKEPVKDTTATEVESMAKAQENTGVSDMEKKMEKILSQIQGAGRVSVLITYVSGKELVPATDAHRSENTTNEKDSGGGTRSINQTDQENKVVYDEAQGGGKKPVILKELQPEVKGVVVVADGAGDVAVRESISRAVQVLTGVPAHKVQVFVKSK